jgi:multiple sugar transport system permease protein
MTAANAYKPQAHAPKWRVGHYGALPYVLILPLVLFMAVLGIYPTLQTFIQSFYSVHSLNSEVKFIGLDNYLAMFRDPVIMKSWAQTGLYIVLGVAISIALAILFAQALRDRFRGRGVVLAILILPWALPGITAGIIWAWIYNPNFGVLNSIMQSLGIIKEYQIWIGLNPLSTIFFIDIVQIWQMTPLSTILILASMQSIPAELYEAASIDGASPLKSAFGITLPLIRPGLTIAIVQSVIITLNIFDQVYVLNGNAMTGISIMPQVYNVTFQNLNFGQGYAMSFAAVLLTVLISVGVMKVVYRKVEY